MRQEITTQMPTVHRWRHTEACQGHRHATVSHGTSDRLSLRVVKFVRPAGLAWVLSQLTLRSHHTFWLRPRKLEETISPSGAHELQSISGSIGEVATVFIGPLWARHVPGVLATAQENIQFWYHHLAGRERGATAGSQRCSVFGAPCPDA